MLAWSDNNRPTLIGKCQFHLNIPVQWTGTEAEAEAEMANKRYFPD